MIRNEGVEIQDVNGMNWRMACTARANGDVFNARAILIDGKEMRL